MVNDRVEGTAREFVGRAQETVGNVTGDSKTQAQGQPDAGCSADYNRNFISQRQRGCGHRYLESFCCL